MAAGHTIEANCHTEDCESWWLPGGSSSVVRALTAQTTGPGFDSWVTAFTFLSFTSYRTTSNYCILHFRGQFGLFATLTWYTDIDCSQLVDAWLVCSTSQEPGVSRAFQITLPMGGNTPTQKVAQQ